MLEPKGQTEPWELHHALVTSLAITAEVSSLTHRLKSPANPTPHTHIQTEDSENTLLVFSLRNAFYYALFQMEKGQAGQEDVEASKSTKSCDSPG